MLGQHHIVTDGWSVGLLVDELVTLYARPVPGARQLPAPPMQYADYARWARGRSPRSRRTSPTGGRSWPG